MNHARDQIRAVTFDAYGTLVRLNRPFHRLVEQLEGIGLSVPLETVTKVFLQEMVFYREHHLEGDTPETLLNLRLRCADVLFSMLAEAGFPADVSRETRLEVLMGSIRFELYEDALPALDWCLTQGLTTAVVSVWDCSLVPTLKEIVPRRFSGVFVSAIEGVQKADAKLFLRAAEGLGIPASDIIHIGDEVENDLLGAEKAGMSAILLDRDRAYGHTKSLRIESLEELPTLCKDRFNLRA